MGAALAIFGLCYAARDRFRPQLILDRVASISYPLYLIHSVVGFTIIAFLVEALAVPATIATLTALTASFLLAYLIHRLVERPTTRRGHRLARPHLRDVEGQGSALDPLGPIGPRPAS